MLGLVVFESIEKLLKDSLTKLDFINKLILSFIILVKPLFVILIL